MATVLAASPLGATLLAAFSPEPAAPTAAKTLATGRSCRRGARHGGFSLLIAFPTRFCTGQHRAGQPPRWGRGSPWSKPDACVHGPQSPCPEISATSPGGAFPHRLPRAHWSGPPVRWMAEGPTPIARHSAQTGPQLDRRPPPPLHSPAVSAQHPGTDAGGPGVEETPPFFKTGPKSHAQAGWAVTAEALAE